MSETGINAVDRNEVQVNKAFDYYQRIITLQKTGIMWFIEMGKTLYTIREEGLFKFMGDGGFDSYADFLNNPEIGFSDKSAYVYTSVYEFYVLKLQMDPESIKDIPLNRLKRMIPLLKDKTVEDAKKAIESTNGQTSKDFEKTVEENNISPDKPEIYLDPENNKWIIRFKPECVLKIVNIRNGQDLLQPVPSAKKSK